MDSVDVLEFLTRHSGHSHYVVAARSAYAHGAHANSTKPVPSLELLEIYQRRADHLSDVPTEHGANLGHELRALCAALEAAPGSLLR